MSNGGCDDFVLGSVCYDRGPFCTVTRHSSTSNKACLGGLVKHVFLNLALVGRTEDSNAHLLVDAKHNVSAAFAKSSL